jgi:hypothetical protein
LNLEKARIGVRIHNEKTRRHRGKEKKDEGGRMMDEEETSITVSSLIFHTFPFLSVPLCLRV